MAEKVQNRGLLCPVTIETDVASDGRFLLLR